jgi:hypothetical protein
MDTTNNAASGFAYPFPLRNPPADKTTSSTTTATAATTATATATTTATSSSNLSSDTTPQAQASGTNVDLLRFSKNLTNLPKLVRIAQGNIAAEDYVVSTTPPHGFQRGLYTSLARNNDTTGTNTTSTNTDAIGRASNSPSNSTSDSDEDEGDDIFLRADVQSMFARLGGKPFARRVVPAVNTTLSPASTCSARDARDRYFTSNDRGNDGNGSLKKKSRTTDDSSSGAGDWPTGDDESEGSNGSSGIGAGSSQEQNAAVPGTDDEATSSAGSDGRADGGDKTGSAQTTTCGFMVENSGKIANEYITRMLALAKQRAVPASHSQTTATNGAAHGTVNEGSGVAAVGTQGTATEPQGAATGTSPPFSKLTGVYSDAIQVLVGMFNRGLSTRRTSESVTEPQEATAPAITPEQRAVAATWVALLTKQLGVIAERYIRNPAAYIAMQHAVATFAGADDSQSNADSQSSVLQSSMSNLWGVVASCVVPVMMEPLVRREDPHATPTLTKSVASGVLALKESTEGAKLDAQAALGFLGGPMFTTSTRTCILDLCMISAEHLKQMCAEACRAHGIPSVFERAALAAYAQPEASDRIHFAVGGQQLPPCTARPVPFPAPVTTGTNQNNADAAKTNEPTSWSDWIKAAESRHQESTRATNVWTNACMPPITTTSSGLSACDAVARRLPDCPPQGWTSVFNNAVDASARTTHGVAYEPQPQPAYAHPPAGSLGHSTAPNSYGTCYDVYYDDPRAPGASSRYGDAGERLALNMESIKQQVREETARQLRSDLAALANRAADWSAVAAYQRVQPTAVWLAPPAMMSPTLSFHAAATTTTFPTPAFVDLTTPAIMPNLRMFARGAPW